MAGRLVTVTVQFQSTFSVRRATTHLVVKIRGGLSISIHVLREESDRRYAPHIHVPYDFNPRSP